MHLILIIWMDINKKLWFNYLYYVLKTLLISIGILIKSITIAYLLIRYEFNHVTKFDNLVL